VPTAQLWYHDHDQLWYHDHDHDQLWYHDHDQFCHRGLHHDHDLRPLPAQEQALRQIELRFPHQSYI
jgi:hypothetical protein